MLNELIGWLDNYNNLLVNFPNVELLFYSNNNITTLEAISVYTKLMRLSCRNNNITSLVSLVKCPEFTKIYCSHNNITSLNPLSVCDKLKILYWK